MTNETARRKTLAMLLAPIGDRRSRVHRIAAGVAVAATFCGSLRIGWAASAPRRAHSSPPSGEVSRRVRPIAVEDANGKIGADTLWKLFDGDASTGLVGGTPVRVRMTFAQPIAVTAVGGYAPLGGRLSLRGPTGDASGETIVAPVGSGDGWLRAPAKQPTEARTFVVDWAPGSQGATLPELEIWGRLGGVGSSPAGGGLADALYEALPEGAEAFAGPSDTRVISVATAPQQRKFPITLPYDPRAIERAFLTYELDLLPHFTAAMRTINGGPAVGGFAVSRGAKGGLQVEEISPSALRKGANTVEFVPVDDKDPVGYRVGRVRVIVVHTADSQAVDDDAGTALVDEMGGWSQPNGSIRRLRFLTISQPRELRLRVPGRQPGKLVVAAGAASNRRTTTVDLDGLQSGTHSVALDTFPPTDEVTLGFEGPAGRKVQLAEVAVSGSPMPAPGGPALRITYPLHGECVNHQVHVRGLTATPLSDLRAGRGGAVHPTLEPGGFSFTASERELGGGGGEPFAFRVAATIAGRQIETTVPIAGCVDRPAVVAGADGASVQPREDVGAPYGVVIKAKRAAKLSFGGLELNVPAGAVDKDVRITVRPLSPDQVPVLDATMENVTAGGRAFRLGPRGMVFKKPVALSIPVDDAKLEPGETPHAFYFDETTDKQWHEIQVTAPGRTRVVASSTHFTDFIASTLKLPEHPGVQSLDPTSLKNIKIADPAAGVEMIAPPQVNSQGTANLNYPIEVPPGRLGMQPSLAITYDSSRGNGWLGVGWDLGVSSIDVDTRFGVPRYDGTERYMIDGEALVPMVQPPNGAPAGTYYARRREGRFDWIQRVNSAGGGYQWLVTDKAGVKHTYGAATASRLAPLVAGTSTVDQARTFKWMLETSEDIYGNQVRYTYTVQRGNNGDNWVQIYPATIVYTAQKSGSPAAPYTVAFSLRAAARGDGFSTGRPGFQVLTQSLLDAVDVKNGTTIVRRYKLTYTTGDFGKSLLQKVELFGKGTTPTTVSANPIAVHTLDYYLTPRDANNALDILGSPTPLGQDTPYSTLYDPNNNPATNQSIRHLEGNQGSYTFSVGFAGAGQSDSYTRGTGMFEDLDGDGLPEFLPWGNSTVGMKPYLDSSLGVLQAPMYGLSFPGLDMPHSLDSNRVMTTSYNFIVTNETEDHGNLSQSSVLHIDVNGDGLLDQVTGAADSALHVKLNLGQLQGFGPEIVIPNYIKTGLGFDCSDIWSSPPAPPPAGSNPQHALPSADVITKWVAPYAGQIRITGKLTRTEQGGDGMLATLLLGNNKLWERTVGPNDLLTTSSPSSCTPQDAAPAIGSACGADTVGLVRTVAKGDRLYTRVNAINDTDHDALKWDTTVEYTSTPSSEQTTKEAWGPIRYKWSEANDERVTGAYYKPWVAPFLGDVHVKLIIDKGDTADDVEIDVDKYTPSTQTATRAATYAFAATFPFHPSDGLPEFDVPSINRGDELHLTIKSDTPIDPETVRVMAAVSYVDLCRNNAFTGDQYCGYPSCTTRPDNDGTSCTVENPAGSGNDPMASTPIAGAVLNQVLPAYYPLQRWIYQRPASPPSTSLDGRRGVFTTSTSKDHPSICFSSPSDLPGTALVLIQGVNKVLARERINLTHTVDVPYCVVAPSQPAGQQIIFSVYSNVPLPQADFSATMSGQCIKDTSGRCLDVVEIYTPDPNLPTLDRFPYVGGIESMASGYHNFYMGLWNGNADFNEADIVRGGSANYSPLVQAPLPKDATGGNLTLDLNPVHWAEDAYNYVSSASEYLWDKVTGTASLFGSDIWHAIRKLGSTLGHLMGWIFCELTGNGYEADGIQVTESHNTQRGFGVIGDVSESQGFSLSGLDLIDMNGDKYPDQVSTKGVRYAYFDPQSNSGRFCPTPQTSASCGSSAPSVTFPGNRIRDIRHAMHTASLSLSVSYDEPFTSPIGRQLGASMLGVSISSNASQGYSHTWRDLKDINGDGLPDIVDVNKGQCTGTGYGLCVQLNYGYGFSAPIPWTSPDWSVAAPMLTNLVYVAIPSATDPVINVLKDVGNSFLSDDTPSSQTIRLEEQGHKGAGSSISVWGSGVDNSYTRTIVDLVDVNGDGLPDQLMKMPNHDYRVKINTGTGFAAETTFPAHPWPTDTLITPVPMDFVQVADTDTLDLSLAMTSSDSENHGFESQTTGPTDRQTVLALMDIDGDGHVDQVLKNADPQGRVAANPRNGMVWARLNQTGQTNLLKTVNGPLGGYFQVTYRREFNFVGDTALPTGDVVKVDMPEARWTMAGVLVTDNRGGAYQDNIDYGRGPGFQALGFYDRTEREFLGYAMARIKHVGSPTSASGPEKRIFFHNQDYYLRGLAYAEYDIEDPVNTDGRVQHGVVTQYQMVGTANAANSQYLAVERRLDQTFNGNIRYFDIATPLSAFSGQTVVSPSPVSHYMIRTWDGFGNMDSVTDNGDLANQNDNLLHSIHYATFSGQHFTAVDKITSTLPGPGTIVAQRDATYVVTNNQPLLMQIQDYVYGGNHPGTTTPYTGQTQIYSFTYDPADLGNLKTYGDPTGYVLTYSYDTATKSHVTNVSDSFSLGSSATYNLDFGLPATTTDENGKVVTYNYDAFGRTSKVWAPGDPTTGQATIQMSYSQAGTTAAAVPWAQTQHKDFQSTTGDTIDTVTFVDGIGRLIQTKKEAELLQANGTTVRGFDISGLTVFDERGRVMAQSQPFFDSATAATTLVPAPDKQATVYTYDAISRVTSVSTADGFRTNTSYVWSDGTVPDDALPGFGTLALEATSDANAHTTRVFKNGMGQVVGNKRFVTIGSTITPAVTTYGYDVFGNVATVTDAGGNPTTATYDSLSRLVSLTSPDAGRTEWRYALTGLLAEKQTPNLRGANQLIKYGYETNRLKMIDYPTMTDVSYVYGLSTEAGDTNGNRAGRVKTVNMEGGTETRSYDAFGNVSQTTTTLNHINDTTLTKPVVTMKYSYDWLGRMKTLTFPKVVASDWSIATGDGEVITYTYDKGGNIDKISGKATPTSTAENYLNDVGYDEFGSRANLVSGNGIVTKYTYTAARHFLNTVTASGKAATGTVQFANYTYGYDPVGNVLTIANNPPQSALQAVGTAVGVGPISITNTYDEMDRLLTSTGKYRGHTTYGHSYSSTFAYDLIDNITSKAQNDTRLNFNASDQGLNGGTVAATVVPTTYSLTYNYTSGKPHQPATLADTNNGTTRTRTEHFDADGNNTGDTIGTTTRTFSWDEADRLKSVMDTGTTKGLFLYDIDGERTQKRDTSNTTSFYFNQFLTIDGSKRMTKHLFAGQTRVVSKTEASSITTPVRSFYHSDYLGSTSYITDASQNLVQHERYFPYGERWWESGLDEISTTNGNIKRDYLYTGKEMDRDTGFYYYGARYLDPRTSNWLSADPILASYVQGKPAGGVFQPSTLGLYTYARNNPVRLLDPDGRFPGTAAAVEFLHNHGVASPSTDQIYSVLYVAFPNDPFLQAWASDTRAGQVATEIVKAAGSYFIPGFAEVLAIIAVLEPNQSLDEKLDAVASAAGRARATGGRGPALPGVGGRGAAGAGRGGGARGDVTSRPSGFRKRTVQDAWDNAAPGSKPDKKACPDCGKDVSVAPGTGRRDWDVDHQPKWSDRDLTGKTRKEVLDEYNTGTRLRCVHDNRADNK